MRWRSTESLEAAFSSSCRARINSAVWGIASMIKARGEGGAEEGIWVIKNTQEERHKGKHENTDSCKSLTSMCVDQSVIWLALCIYNCPCITRTAPVGARLESSGRQSLHHLAGSPHMTSSLSSFLHLRFIKSKEKKKKQNISQSPVWRCAFYVLYYIFSHFKATSLISCMFRNEANICKIVQVNNITMLIKFKPLGTQHTCYNWMVSTTDELVQVLARWTYTGLARADRAGYSHTRLSPARWIKPDPAVSYSPPHHLCTGTHRKEKNERKNTCFKQLCKPEVRTGQNWRN